MKYLLLTLLLLAGCTRPVGELPMWRFWCVKDGKRSTAEHQYTARHIMGYLDSPDFHMEGRLAVWRLGGSTYIQSAGEMCYYVEVYK